MKQQQRLNTALCTIFLTVATVSSNMLGQNSRPEAETQPNVVFFLVDDMGWQDTSVPFHTETTDFNKRYRTPNMERLAEQGTLYTNAYASCPVCTPTRVSIMTGQHPARLGITNWTLHAHRDSSAGHDRLRSPAWNTQGLQPDALTLAELLQANGYCTIHAGKAHWGALDTPGADPLNHGFDINIAGHAAGAPGSYYGTDNFSDEVRRGKPQGNSPWPVPGLDAYHGQEVYLTEVLTKESIKAIDDAIAVNKPFFLHLGHYAVHTPIMADPSFIDHYPELSKREAAYASMVEGVDQSLGQLMDALDERGILDNTIIIFTSDNGGLSGRAGASENHNAPLRHGKGFAYEGGVRIPQIISVPGSQSSRTDRVTVSQDLFPTILQMTNTEIPIEAANQMDGHSIVDSLDGKNPDAYRVVGWHYPHQWTQPGPGLQAFTSIRAGNEKLIYFYGDEQFELYDLEDDISEKNNLASAQPHRVEELSQLMRHWMRQTGAKTPINKETNQPLSLPSLHAWSSQQSNSDPMLIEDE